MIPPVSLLPHLAAHFNSNMGLIGLLAIVIFIIGLARWSKRMRTGFLQGLDAAGFQQAATVPPLVAEDRPWLNARVGTPPLQRSDVLFLHGLKSGVAGHPPEPYQGFLLPASMKLSAEALERFRQAHRRHLLAAAPLEDGTHFFLWMQPFRPACLAVTLGFLREAQGAAAEAG